MNVLTPYIFPCCDLLYYDRGPLSLKYNNANVTYVSIYCFSNPIVSCDEIKKLNLEAWQDPALIPDILTRTNKWIKDRVANTGNTTK